MNSGIVPVIRCGRQQNHLVHSKLFLICPSRSRLTNLICTSRQTLFVCFEAVMHELRQNVLTVNTDRFLPFPGRSVTGEYETSTACSHGNIALCLRHHVHWCTLTEVRRGQKKRKGSLWQVFEFWKVIYLLKRLQIKDCMPYIDFDCHYLAVN